MAIVIEEEKEQGGGWFGIGVLFVVFAIFAIAVYFLFFVRPELIDTVAPVKLRSIDELTQLNFDPSSVVSNSFFQSLSQVVPPPSPPISGNSSPFGVF